MEPSFGGLSQVGRGFFLDGEEPDTLAGVGALDGFEEPITFHALVQVAIGAG